MFHYGSDMNNFNLPRPNIQAWIVLVRYSYVLFIIHTTG